MTNTSTVIQGSITAAGASIVLVVDGFVQAALQITGTWSGTLLVEATVDGSTYFTVDAIPIPASSSVSSITTNGQWLIQTAGFLEIRIRCSSYDAGTAQVSLRAVASGGGTGSNSISDLQVGAVEIKDGTTDARVTAKVDNAAAGTPTPLSIGGKYNASAPTYDDGDQVTSQYDINGNQKVTQGTLLAGEDLTNDVQKVEQRFSYAYCAGADTSVKSGAGFLHTITFSQIDAAPTAGTIIIYDNTAESGTIIFSSTWTTAVFYPTTITLDVSFSTGLYIGFTTTADIGVTVSYR